MKYFSIGTHANDGTKDGIVFDIQRYSLHDGTGIRTLVFFSGCSLRCVWCANPESQSAKPSVMWDGKTCRRCRKCNEICPTGAIGEGEEGKRIDRDKCIACGLCDDVCASHSIALAGRYVTVGEVMAEAARDEVFYETSGGGVSIGGGEPLLQPNFARAVLIACKAKGYNTAVETAGHVPWNNIDLVREYADLFLYDIKTMDPERHRRFVGPDNALILENARKLTAAGANVLVRMPVIPGVNDAPESIDSVATFAGSIGAVDFELLPYHSLGMGKYAQLGETYLLNEAKRFDDETVAAMKARARDIYRSSAREPAIRAISKPMRNSTRRIKSRRLS